MKIYTLPYFPELDLELLEEYYSVDIEFKNRKLEIDINFDSISPAKSQMDLIKDFLQSLDKFDSKNRIFIDDNYKKQKSVVQEYLQLHIEELEDEFLGLLENINTSEEKEIVLKQNLQLQRIGFYPNESDCFMVCDYVLNEEVSDELLVIHIKSNKEIDYITWES